MMDCVRQFHQILDTIPQSEAAFQIAKDAVLKQMASQRITKMNVLNLYLSMQRLGLSYDLNEQTYRNLQNVTLQDIVRAMAANGYITDVEEVPAEGERGGYILRFRIVTIDENGELDMPSLEKIGPIRRLTIEEVFGY